MVEQNKMAATQVDVAKLYRELRVNRVINVITSLLMVFVLAGGGIFYLEMRKIQEREQPLIEQVSAVDVEELNQTLKLVNTTLETVDWEKLTQALEELDVESINEAIKNLDTQELSEALKNLNNAVDTLKQLGEKLKPLASFF